MADRGFNVILVIADVLTHIIMIQDTAAPAPVTRRVAVVADTVRVCRTFFRPRICDTNNDGSQVIRPVGAVAAIAVEAILPGDQALVKYYIRLRNAE